MEEKHVLFPWGNILTSSPDEKKKEKRVKVPLSLSFASIFEFKMITFGEMHNNQAEISMYLCKKRHIKCKKMNKNNNKNNTNPQPKEFI